MENYLIAAKHFHFVSRILVLEDGKVREFDSPANLISAGPSSLFYRFVQEAGLLESHNWSKND